MRENTFTHQQIHVKVKFEYLLVGQTVIQRVKKLLIVGFWSRKSTPLLSQGRVCRPAWDVT